LLAFLLALLLAQFDLEIPRVFAGAGQLLKIEVLDLIVIGLC